jgi:hypothetical protein
MDMYSYEVTVAQTKSPTDRSMSAFAVITSFFADRIICRMSTLELLVETVLRRELDIMDQFSHLQNL